MTGSRQSPSLILEPRGRSIGSWPGRVPPIFDHAGGMAVRAFVTVLFAPWIVLAGRARQVLLAVVLLDIPLQIDKNFFYLDDAADFGAIGGFEISLTTLALAILYAGWFVDRNVRGDRTRVPGDLIRPLFAYVAVAALSLVVAYDIGLYSRGLFLLVQNFLVYAYLVGNIRSREDVRFVVKWLLCGLALEGAVIIVLAVRGQSFDFAWVHGRVDEWSDDLVASARFGGTVGSPNNAAAYFEMLLPAAAAVLASSFGPGCRALAALGLALGSPALVATLSRGGWIATAVSLAIVCAALWWRGRLAGAVPWLAALGLIVALTFHGSIAARLTDDDEGSAHSRVPLMATAFRIIGDHPVLGVGANNYTAALPDYASRHENAWLYTVHNQWLLIWAETGIVGLAAFLWFVIATIRRGVNVWKRSDPLLAPLALGFTAALVGHTLHMQVDLFNDRPQLQLLVTVAALIAVMSRMHWRGDAGTPAPTVRI